MMPHPIGKGNTCFFLLRLPGTINLLDSNMELNVNYIALDFSFEMHIIFRKL